MDQDLERLEEKHKKKNKERLKSKHKQSGRSVFKLQEIIKKKTDRKETKDSQYQN